MGLIRTKDIDDTLNGAKSAISDCASRYYSLKDSDKIVFAACVTQYMLALWVKEQILEGNADIIKKVKRGKTITISSEQLIGNDEKDQDKYQIKYKNIKQIVSDIQKLRNMLCHDYNTKVTSVFQDNILSQDEDIRKLLKIFSIDMQEKPTDDDSDNSGEVTDNNTATPFLAAIKMAGD